MAKKELLAEAQKAGLVPDTATEEDFTAAQLQELLNPESSAVWEGSASSSEPLVAPDGHVSLSQEDIDARDS